METLTGSRGCPLRMPIHAEPFREADRIERRMHLGIVVEVNENVAFSIVAFLIGNQFSVMRLPPLPPFFYSSGPPIQGLAIVAADVEFLRTMQAAVNKIRCQVLGVWPLAGSVGKDEGYIVLAKKLKELPCHKAWVADLHRVTKRLFRHGGIDLCPSGCFQFVIMLSRQYGRLLGGSRQLLEKFG